MFNIFKKQVKKSPEVFIFIGRSGCGKGTQIKLLEAFLKKRGNSQDFLHIESGVFLREYVKGNSYTQEKTKLTLESGLLVPESVVVYLWMHYLAVNFTGTESMIFDGCPRKIDEAKMLYDTLSFYNIEKPKVIYVNVSSDWAMQRLQGRGRKDDSPEGIKNRMDFFETEVMSVIEYFKYKEDFKFIEVNGEQTIEEVQNEILAKLGLNL